MYAEQVKFPWYFAFFLGSSPEKTTFENQGNFKEFLGFKGIKTKENHNYFSYCF
jgi:hypothetical protein